MTQPTKVEAHVRRGGSSRYAKEIRDMEFRAIRHVVVAQNTPTWLHRNAPGAVDIDTNPLRWEKVDPRPNSIMATLATIDSGTDIAVWIKTATLGGHAKVYVKPLS